MMLLRYSPTSPFAKKVCVVAAELGITHKISLVPTRVREENVEFFADNPLAKIPVLITASGYPIYDSKVICAYLDAEYGDEALSAPAGDERWHASTKISLADGLVNAGLLARYESRRPDESRSDDDITFQMAKIKRGLDWFNQHHALDPSRFQMEDIALACALEWLSFRFGMSTTFNERGQLKSWYDVVKLRPSMAEPTIRSITK